MSSSDAGAAAYNAGVQINGKDVVAVPPRTSQQQEYLDVIAEQSEAAVPKIERQIEGLQESLKAAKTAAKQARAEANSEEN